MKRISLMGIGLGFLLGLIASLLSGSWILWLALGLAIGVVVGSTSARRSLLVNANARRGLKP
jgi:hypothetical protein